MKNRKLGESLDQRQVYTVGLSHSLTLSHIHTQSLFSSRTSIILNKGIDALQVIEDELRERIERLETRQATDDASLLILNRYWNQVTIQIMNIIQLKHCT